MLYSNRSSEHPRAESSQSSLLHECKDGGSLREDSTSLYESIFCQEAF